MKAEFFALVLLLNSDGTQLHDKPDYYGPQLLDQETCVDMVKARVEKLVEEKAAPKIAGICVFVPAIGTNDTQQQQESIKSQVQALLVNARGKQSVPSNWKE